MADLGSPLPRPSALGDLLAERRRGPGAEPPGVRLSERSARVLWQVAAWRADAVASLGTIVAEHLHLTLPEAPAAAASQRGVVAFAIAPRRWWLVAPAAGRELDAALADALAGRAALTDLSHARTLLHLSGPASRGTLAKLCRIDLHPRAFPPGRVAQTPLGQIAALIHALDDGLSFDLYLPRSLARSAAVSLIDAAAEFGLALGGQAD
jgi:heterotetrameric sarcosine oxidase gamma subunit